MPGYHRGPDPRAGRPIVAGACCYCGVTLYWRGTPRVREEPDPFHPGKTRMRCEPTEARWRKDEPDCPGFWWPLVISENDP